MGSQVLPGGTPSPDQVITSLRCGLSSGARCTSTHGFADLTWTTAGVVGAIAAWWVARWAYRELAGRVRSDLDEISEHTAHSKSSLWDRRYPAPPRTRGEFLRLWGRSKDLWSFAGFRRSDDSGALRPYFLPSNLLIVDPKSHSEIGDRIIAPAIAMRSGPSVVISRGTGLLHRGIADRVTPIIRAQGSTALWWSPDPDAVCPEGCVPVMWDPLSSTPTVSGTIDLARELVTSIVADIDRGKGLSWFTSQCDSEIEHTSLIRRTSRDAVTAISGLLLAAQLEGLDIHDVTRSLTLGPTTWSRSASILCSSHDEQITKLGSQLLHYRRDGLGAHEPHVLSILAIAAEALDRCSLNVHPGTVHLRVTQLLISVANVLFIDIGPRDDFVSNAAVSAVVHEIHSRQSRLRHRPGPLTFAVESIEQTVKTPTLQKYLQWSRNWGVVWIGSTTSTDQWESVWGERRAHAMVAAMPSTLIFEEDSSSAGRETQLESSVDGHRTLVNPDFDEQPWIDVSDAARTILMEESTA